MVVFTCNHCGSSIQKPKVLKHYQLSCKNPIFLTCVDCLKDFRGEEYDAHVKCVSENQRYGNKKCNSVVINKGERKQESWLEMIRSIIKAEPNIKQSRRDLLNHVAGFHNVPRTKPKFTNFVRNSCPGRTYMSDIEAIWNIIEKYKTEKSSIGGNKNDQTQDKSTTKNIYPAGVAQQKCGEKRKYLETDNEFQPTEKKVKGELNKKSKFDFTGVILDNILQAAELSISPMELKSRVEKLYVKETGETLSDKALRKYLKQMENIIECTEQYVKLR